MKKLVLTIIFLLGVSLLPAARGDIGLEEASRVLSQEREKHKDVSQQEEGASREGLLLKKGKMELEPSFSYMNFSNNNLSVDGFALLPVFVVGQIQSQKVKRDILVTSLGLNYGLLDNLQVEVAIPYRYRRDDIVFSSNQETIASQFGIGDISLGMGTQILFQSSGKYPDLIGDIKAFIPTGDSPFNYDPSNPKDENIPLGSGFWGITGTLTSVTVSDPAMIFGSLHYTYNFSRTVSGNIISGEVTPGPSIGYNLGLAVALNYQLSINFQFAQEFTAKTSVENVAINDSSLNNASFSVGSLWSYTNNRSVNFSLSMGITQDAPDLVLQVSFPMRF